MPAKTHAIATEPPLIFVTTAMLRYRLPRRHSVKFATIHLNGFYLRYFATCASNNCVILSMKSNRVVFILPLDKHPIFIRHKNLKSIFVMEEKKNKEENELTDYEKYCKMMAQQQEDEMDEICFESMPEGQFVRGH